MRQQSFIKRLIVLQGVILLLLIALSACFQRDVVVVVATPTPAPETPTAEEPSEMTSIPTEEATDEPDEEPGSPRRPTVASVPTVRPENTQEPASESMPVSAPVNLSTLEDPVQETIQWASVGAGLPTGDVPCPNHNPNGEWLVVGGFEELKTRSVATLPFGTKVEDFQEGIAPGIGRESIICAHFREELRRGDRITLEVVKPEGAIERATFAYNPISDPELTLMAEDFQRYVDHSFEDDNLTLVYAPRQGSPVGTYVIILRINEREVARQSLQVGFCDCPTIRLSNSSSDRQPLEVGETLELEFTGFKSTEQLRMALADLQVEPGKSYDTIPSGVTRYSWLAQLDERGEYYQEIVVDHSIIPGYYALLNTSVTESNGFCGFIAALGAIEIYDTSCRTTAAPVVILPSDGGVKIVEVQPGSPAEEVGLQPGQIILMINSYSITSVEEARSALVDSNDHSVLVHDGDDRRWLTVKPENGVIGVELCELEGCLPADTPTSTPTDESLPRIAFTSNYNDNLDIYVIDLDGSDLINLTNHPAEDWDPDWSPDGQRIAFHTNRDGNWETYVMDADGSNQRRLTNHPADDTYPAWSPNGRRIAINSNRDGDEEIYVMNADGSSVTNLTNFADGDDLYPAWSPDGSQIAFNSNRDGNEEIYVMNADGSNQRRLTNHPASDTFATWSPEGSQIAFQSTRDGNAEIYILDLQDGQLTNLTNSPERDIMPDWLRLENVEAIAYSTGDNNDIQLIDVAQGETVSLLQTDDVDEWTPDWQPISGLNR